MTSLTETRPATYTNGIVDVAGLPTFAEVDRAMSAEGRAADLALWSKLNLCWDRLAWGTPCYEGVERRRQACYEACAKELAQVRLTAPAAPCCGPDEAAPCLACVPGDDQDDDQGGPETDPQTWPNWTDNWHWSADPLPADAAWAAEEFADADDEDLDELAALEAAVTDSLALGLIPRDLAESIARTSLVGLADEIIHRGSDPRFCGCERCTLDRTAQYADAE